MFPMEDQGHIMAGECYGRIKDLKGKVLAMADSRTKRILCRLWLINNIS